MPDDRVLAVTMTALQAATITGFVLFLLHGLSVLTPLPPLLQLVRVLVAAVCGVAVIVLFTGLTVKVWLWRPTNTDDPGGSPSTADT